MFDLQRNSKPLLEIKKIKILVLTLVSSTVVTSDAIDEFNSILCYVPRRIMRFITQRATMLAGDRSQRVLDA